MFCFRRLYRWQLENQWSSASSDPTHIVMITSRSHMGREFRGFRFSSCWVSNSVSTRRASCNSYKKKRSSVAWQDRTGDPNCFIPISCLRPKKPVNYSRLLSVVISVFTQLYIPSNLPGTRDWPVRQGLTRKKCLWIKEVHNGRKTSTRAEVRFNANSEQLDTYMILCTSRWRRGEKSDGSKIAAQILRCMPGEWCHSGEVLCEGEGWNITKIAVR